MALLCDVTYLKLSSLRLMHSSPPHALLSASCTPLRPHAIPNRLVLSPVSGRPPEANVQDTLSSTLLFWALGMVPFFGASASVQRASYTHAFHVNIQKDDAGLLFDFWTKRHPRPLWTDFESKRQMMDSHEWPVHVMTTMGVLYFVMHLCLLT